MTLLLTNRLTDYKDPEINKKFVLRFIYKTSIEATSEFNLQLHGFCHLRAAEQAVRDREQHLSNVSLLFFLF